MKKEFIQVEPSMIAADWGNMAEDARLSVDAGAEILHLDVMDGHFVPNLAIGPDLVAAIRRNVSKSVKLDVHLMIYQPENYIERFVKAGADEITIHLEATEEIAHALKYIKTCGCEAGLAVKPGTSETLLLPYLGEVDKILIMTVEPGFGGQAFMADMLEKVTFIREEMEKLGLKKDIQVDGGINFETGAASVAAGANRLVTGSHFFKQPNRKEGVDKYNKLRAHWKYTV